MLQMFGLQCIFFSCTQMNKRRIFLLRHLVSLSSFYIRENIDELSFWFLKKIKGSFWKSFKKYSKVSSSIIKPLECELNVQYLIWECLDVKLLWHQNSVFLFCLTYYKKQTHEWDKNLYRLNRRN